jgi:lipoprotein-anchoring transpeptidase ErfK/SrfK
VLGNRRTRLAVYATLGALALIAVAAYLYDSSRDDLIAEGVRVEGVDLGGLRRDAAEQRLTDRLASRLERPVRVKVAGRRFRLTAERSGLAVQVDEMVDAAIERSRSGGLHGRVWRGLTGGSIEADLPAEVTYSRLGVRGFVNRVARAVNRRARDAEVKFTTASLPAVPSQTGLKLRAGRLRRSVTAGLGAVGSDRTVRGEVEVVQPKVTTAELSGKYPYVITIDRPSFKLRLFKNLRPDRSYEIAVGQVGLETPAGLYHVQNKAVNPSWHVPNSDWAGDLAGKVIPPGPDNPIKSRWLGIYNGAGIHGTADIASLGTAASHGCIRMAIPDVEELYDIVPVQTPVYVQ